jgi:hypothetical protein
MLLGIPYCSLISQFVFIFAHRGAVMVRSLSTRSPNSGNAFNSATLPKIPLTQVATLLAKICAGYRLFDGLTHNGLTSVRNQSGYADLK